MPISNKHNLILVHIPKNAGTSIEETLEMNELSGHHKWYNYKYKVPEKWENYYKFSVVRNPFDRVVSNYVYARKEVSYWHNALNPDKSRYGKHRDYDTLKNKSFREAVHMIGDLEHQGWRDQYTYISDGEEIFVDRVLKMENLTDGFNQMLSDLGVVGYDLKHINSSRDENNYKSYYDRETREIVTEYYETDLELFDYSF